MLIVFTTCPNREEAEALARKLVEQKLAGCVQIVPQITSVYEWEGKVRQDNEYLLLIKTTDSKFGPLSAFIKENHSYDVPEIVAVKAENVSAEYLNWLNNAIS